MYRATPWRRGGRRYGAPRGGHRGASRTAMCAVRDPPLPPARLSRHARMADRWRARRPFGRAAVAPCLTRRKSVTSVVFCIPSDRVSLRELPSRVSIRRSGLNHVGAPGMAMCGRRQKVLRPDRDPTAEARSPPARSACFSHPVQMSQRARSRRCGEGLHSNLQRPNYYSSAGRPPALRSRFPHTRARELFNTARTAERRVGTVRSRAVAACACPLHPARS